jgi:hypothetical protein
MSDPFPAVKKKLAQKAFRSIVKKMRMSANLKLNVIFVLLLTLSLSAEESNSTKLSDLSDQYDGMVGLRIGSEFGSKHFRSYEAFLSVETPYQWTMRDAWIWRLDVEAALGVLERRSSRGIIANVGPVVAFEPLEGRWGLRVGFAPTLISRDKYAAVDLGGNIQFSSSVSAYWRFNENCCVLYRYQHTSNGGLRPSNPGLDLHSLGVAYRF